MGIDMDTATIFITGFHNEIPTGALLLVFDQPMVPEGVKTALSDEAVSSRFLKIHPRIGIGSLSELIHHGHREASALLKRQWRDTLRSF
jgi:AMP nucleosidase